MLGFYLMSSLYANTLTVADITNPEIVNLTPIDDAVNVGIDDALYIQFDENITLVDSGGVTLHKTSDDSSVSATVTASGDTVTVTPDASLLNNTGYYVLISATAIDDTSSNSFAGIAAKTTYNFTTVPSGSDTTAPLIVSSNPADNSSDVDLGITITITFNENINLIVPSSVKLLKSSDSSEVSSTISANGSVLTIDPQSRSLLEDTEYYVSIAANALRDDAGNYFAGLLTSTALNFSTGTLSAPDTTKPTVSSLSPLDNATDVAVGNSLEITFDETVVIADSNGIGVYRTSDDAEFTSVASVNGAVLTINPTGDLAYSTDYYVNIAANAIEDSSGNNFLGILDETTYNFTTVAEPSDTTDPTVSVLTPTDNATDVNVSATLSIQFDEAINLVDSNGVTLHKTSDDSTVSAVASKSGTDTVLINPDANLDYSTSYYVNISATAIDDLAGNSFAGISNKTDYNFTTAASSSFTISSSTPSDGDTAVDVNDSVIITFNENVNVLDKLGFTLHKTSDDSLISCAVTYTGATVTMQPIGTLTGATSYYVLIASDAVEDIYSNSFAGILTKTELDFTTESVSLPAQSSTTRFHDMTYVNTPDFSDLNLTARVLNKDYVCIVVDPSEFILARQKAHCEAWLAYNIPNTSPADYTQTTNFGLMWLETQYNYVPEMTYKMREPSYWTVNDSSPTDYAMFPQVVSNRSFNIVNDYSDIYSGSIHPDRLEYFKTGSPTDYAFYCYIKTPSSMVHGNSYTFKDHYGNSVVVNYSNTASHSWAIKVNQLGYVNSAKKYAYLGMWLGPELGGLDFSAYSGNTFHLRRVSDDVSVYNSTIAYRMNDPFRLLDGNDYQDINALVQDVTGEYKQYEMDFSAYTTTGEFYIQVDGIGKSWPFKIDSEANVYGDLFYWTNRSLLYQRGHTNLTSTYTEWPFNSNYYDYSGDKLLEIYKSSKAPSLELANYDVSANGNWGWYDETDGLWYEDWTITKFGGGHNYQIDYLSQGMVEEIPEDDVKWNVTGGLMDAADLDRRRFHLHCATYPSIAYLLGPTKFVDNQLNIPESGDGVPDILSNVEPALEWIKSMQTSLGTGAVVLTAEQAASRRGDYYTSDNIPAALTASTSTSTTSMSISADEKTFTIGTGLTLKYDPWGHYKAVVYYDSTNYMAGWLKSYNSTTGEAVFVPYASKISGSGTYANWTFFQSIHEYENLEERFYTGEPTRIGCYEYAYTAAVYGKALLEAGATTLGNAYVTSAEDAYDWAEAQTQIILGTTVRDGHTIRWYGPSDTDEIFKHSRLWAIIALRIATGSAGYLTELNTIGDTYFESDATSIANGCKNNPQGYYFRKNCIDLAIIWKYTSLMPTGWATHVSSAIASAADSWVANMDYNMYRQPWKAEPIEWTGTQWQNVHTYTGSWEATNWGWRSSAVMSLLLTAYEVTSTASYKEYALYGLDYYLGCNPKGRTQYSGVGQSSIYWWLFNMGNRLWERGEYPRGYEIYGGNPYISGHMAVASAVAANCFAYRDYTSGAYSVSNTVLLPEPYENITTYDYGDMKSKLNLMIPLDRRHYCNETNEVAQNEFTCWETQVYAMYASAMIMGTGYTPSTEIKTLARRTEAESFNSRFFQP